MQKIMIFYDSTDLALARRVASEVNATGFVPWLADDNSKINWYAEVEELAQSDQCAGAIVIWSEESKANSIVRDEAKEVVKAKKPLLSLLLNNISEAPIGLRDGPRFSFSEDPDHNLISELILKISAVFGDAAAEERALILNGKKLHGPSMVLSVSSFETQITPDAALSLLSYANPPATLVSAYDLLRPRRTKKQKPKITNISSISSLRDSGSLVFLDSGNYEAMRYKDKKWKEEEHHLLDAQELVEVDLAFTHDAFPNVTSFENVSVTRRVDEISAEYERDTSLLKCAVAPIIHAPRLSGNRYCHHRLPEICCGVVQAVTPPMIAVAERELGDGIMERICTVAKIRKALDQQGQGTILHVLGTGNPITMAFLSLAGADFFDGLEWCRTSIDGKSWRLYHFQQWDMFASQTGLITSPEIAALIRNQSGETPWFIKVIFHNMAFFLQASQEIRTHHIEERYERLFSDKDLWVEYQLAREKLEELN